MKGRFILGPKVTFFRKPLVTCEELLAFIVECPAARVFHLVLKMTNPLIVIRRRDGECPLSKLLMKGCEVWAGSTF